MTILRCVRLPEDCEALYQELYQRAAPDRKRRADRYLRLEDGLRCLAAGELLRDAVERELGIDSIKRVEILSMVNNTLGGIFTKEHVEELSGISKIADMVAYLNTIGGAAPVTEPAPAVEEATVEAAPAASNEKLSEIILAAIADKTGYPEDMIDNDMELEADLGIDSIKRVEIFAEVLKKLAITLTAEQTEELSTMSTVEAIAAYLSTLV